MSRCRTDRTRTRLSGPSSPRARHIANRLVCIFAGRTEIRNREDSSPVSAPQALHGGQRILRAVPGQGRDYISSSRAVPIRIRQRRIRNDASFLEIEEKEKAAADWNHSERGPYHSTSCDMVGRNDPLIRTWAQRVNRGTDQPVHSIEHRRGHHNSRVPVKRGSLERTIIIVSKSMKDIIIVILGSKNSLCLFE